MRRARGLCSTLRCPNLVEAHGKCAQHLREQRAAFDRARPSSSERGYDAEWRRIRAEFIRQHPICAVPECNDPTEDVDHTPRYVPGTDHRNYRLTGYCHRHHSARTSVQVR